ncbi:nitrate/nitrite transporter [Tistrella mobilis]|uniref:MFS transporter n=1 Tax=Tistrella mobilis TaxID=171437 RepID=UPI0035577088
MKRQMIVLNLAMTIAVTFGMARYGFGLFLPDIAADFSLSPAQLGLISSSTYIAYFSATLISLLWTSALGARAMLAIGVALATFGMAIIGTATTLAALIAGFIIAGASPGLVFSPTSEAISITFSPGRRGVAFSMANAGEGVGAVLSAVLLMIVWPDWRMAWLLFSAVALISLLLSWRTTPPGTASATRSAREALRATVAMFAWSGRALLISSFILGVTTTVFWTFAGALGADETVSISGFRLALRVILWITVGFASIAGVIAAPLLSRHGLRSTYALSIVAVAVALGLSAFAQQSLSLLLISGAAFGTAYIMATSQLGAWSLVVHHALPSAGFGLTFLAFAVGAVVGPTIAGWIIESSGFSTVFLVSAAVTLLLLLFMPADPNPKGTPSHASGQTDC